MKSLLLVPWSCESLCVKNICFGPWWLLFWSMITFVLVHDGLVTRNLTWNFFCWCHEAVNLSVPPPASPDKAYQGARRKLGSFPAKFCSTVESTPSFKYKKKQPCLGMLFKVQKIFSNHTSWTMILFLISRNLVRVVPLLRCPCPWKCSFGNMFVKLSCTCFCKTYRYTV